MKSLLLFSCLALSGRSFNLHKTIPNPKENKPGRITRDSLNTAPGAFITPEQSDNRDRVIEYVRSSGEFIFSASERLQRDEDVLNLALKTSYNALVLLPEQLKSHKETYLKIIADNRERFFPKWESHLPDELRKDREFLEILKVVDVIKNHPSYENIDFTTLLNPQELARISHEVADIFQDRITPELFKKWVTYTSTKSHAFQRYIQPSVSTFYNSQTPLSTSETASINLLFPFDLTFIETNPDSFLPSFSNSIRDNGGIVISDQSLYKVYSSEYPDDVNTQETLYKASSPTILFIASDHIHSGHNDLLQDRRWLNRKISDHIKIVIVGSYEELTADVQDRIEAEYLDPHSVQSKKSISRNRLAPSRDLESRYKELPRLTASELLNMEFNTLEESLQGQTSSKKNIVLQNSDELASLPDTEPSRRVSRYLPTYLSHLEQKKPPFSSTDLVLYQYRSSVFSQIEAHLKQNGISLDDPKKMADYLKSITVLIPNKPKLDILSGIHHRKGQWSITFQAHDYPVSGVQTYDLSTITSDIGDNWKLTGLAGDTLDSDYFDSDRLFTKTGVSIDILDTLIQFVDNPQTLLIFQGVPALGKDAYTKHFISILKQLNPDLYSEVISASQDQSLLDQVISIYKEHPEQKILLQVSEINLISEFQLNEVLHFCDGKPIKIIGTQNAQSQINNRYKLNNKRFPVVELTQDSQQFIASFIEWIEKKHGVSFELIRKHLIDMYGKASYVKPPSPRQLISLARKLNEFIHVYGEAEAYKKLPSLFNSVFIRYTPYLYIAPVKDNTRSNSRDYDIFRNIVKEFSKDHASPESPVDTNSDNKQSSTTRIEKNKTVPQTETKDKVESVSKPPVSQKTTPKSELPKTEPSLKVKHAPIVVDKSFSESPYISMEKLNKVRNHVTSSYGLLPGRDHRKGLWEGVKRQFMHYTNATRIDISQKPLNKDVNTIYTTLQPNDRVVLPTIIGSNHAILSIHNDRQESIQNCDDMLDRDSFTLQNSKKFPIEVRILFSDSLPLYTLIKQEPMFMTESTLNLEAPLDTSHLSESEASLLTRFIYEMTRIKEATKKELLVALEIDEQIAYTKNNIFEGIYSYFREFTEEDIPDDTTSENQLLHALLSQRGVCRHQAELGRIIFLALGIQVEKKVTLDHLGQPLHEYIIVTEPDTRFIMNFNYTPLSKMPKLKENMTYIPQIIDITPLDLLSVQERLYAPLPNYVYSEPLMSPKNIYHIMTSSYNYANDIGKSVPLVLNYVSNYYEAIEDALTTSTASEIPLSKALTGSSLTWNSNKKDVVYNLLESIPSQGTVFETRFVPASSTLDMVGIPVYGENQVLLGYKVQREVPSDIDHYSALVLHPNDKVEGGSESDTLILTLKGLMTLEDYRNDDKTILIDSTNKVRARALYLVKTLSQLANMEFVYSEEYEALKKQMRHLRGGGHSEL